MFRKKKKTEKTEEKVHDEKERRAAARFYAVLLSVVITFLLFFNFWSSNFAFVIVSGDSMNNTFQDGEYLLSYKVINPEHELKRGDVIIVSVGHIPEWQEKNEKYPNNQTHFIIKRLIALEGDIVRSVEGELEICYAGTWNETMDYANYPFVDLDEPYAYYDESRGGKKAVCNTFEYTVGEGEIFFLGDNRNDSVDSRYEIKDKNGKVITEYSTLKGRLYKETDVTAIVPDWAIKRQRGLQKCLVDIPAKIKNFLLKPFR